MGPGTDRLGVRNRKDEASAPTPTIATSNTPTFFRMATEETLNREAIEAAEPGQDSTYGVQSLTDTMCESQSAPDDGNEEDTANGDHEDDVWGRRRSTLRPKPRTIDTFSENKHGFDPQLPTTTSSPSGPSQHSRAPSISHSLTSSSFHSHTGEAPSSSLPSSPKSTSNRSFRPSDEDSMDEGGSQAIASSEEEDGGSSSEMKSSAPELVMPSITMPSRRPFTGRGKSLGRLKMLIAGDSGVGKTSLIKSIVQTCHDIVHVDPLSPSLPSMDKVESRKAKSKHHSSMAKTTQYITEIFASTKAYPPWWSEGEDGTALPRRKSMGDTVLERNLCFVDTPGYSCGMSKMENIESVLRYINIQLSSSFSSSASTEGERVNLLSGNGGSQVDVVFYLISQELKYEDVVFLQHLARLTNVVPMIAKSDTLSFEEMKILRRSICDNLREESVKTFNFGTDDAIHLPYLICSAPSDDNDTMDASLLMSPEYVRPLIPSELPVLVQQMFDRDNALCLRHLAAKKLVRAQRASGAANTRPQLTPPTSNSLSNSQTAHSTSPSSTATSINKISYAHGISPYVQAKIADHTQHEEKLAQIRLAKWAGDLQRSLENERARYEATARADHALWVTKKLGECEGAGSSTSAQDSVLVRQNDNHATGRKLGRTGATSQYGLTDAGDPLGLLRWNEAMKRRGWIAFQVVGGFGILGALAMWAAKTWAFGVNGTGDRSWDWWRGP